MTDEAKGADRRSFLASVAMWAGLAAGYGLGLYHFLRYLVPMGEQVGKREMFVCTVDDLEVGESRVLKTPAGDSFVMARTAREPVAESFRILSDICPHLGCRVHWEPQNNRFFCPCHEGVFDPEGKAVAGPPAEAGQALIRLDPVIRDRDRVFVLIRES